MARPSPYPDELRRRAVRMVAEVRPDYDSEWAAMRAVAAKRAEDGGRAAYGRHPHQPGGCVRAGAGSRPAPECGPGESGGCWCPRASPPSGAAARW